MVFGCQKRLHCVKHQSSIFGFLGLDVARGWFNQSGNYIVAAASCDVVTMTSLAVTSLADAQTAERQTRVRYRIFQTSFQQSFHRKSELTRYIP